MDAQVAVVLQGVADGVGQGADPHLQRRPVLDQIGDDPTDGEVGRLGLGPGHDQQGGGVFDDPGDPGDMDGAVAEHARHVRIDLDHDGPGRVRHRLGVVRVGPEREESVGVHRRDGADQRIHPDFVAQQARRLLEAGRDELDRIGPPLLEGALLQPAFDGAVEQAPRPDPVHQLVAQHRVAGDGGGEQIIEVHILDLAALSPFGQGLQQGRGLGHAQAHGDLGARPDQGRSLVRCFQPFGIEGGVVHGVSPVCAPLCSDRGGVSRQTILRLTPRRG